LLDVVVVVLVVTELSRVEHEDSNEAEWLLLLTLLLLYVLLIGNAFEEDPILPAPSPDIVESIIRTGRAKVGIVCWNDTIMDEVELLEVEREVRSVLATAGGGGVTVLREEECFPGLV